LDLLLIELKGWIRLVLLVRLVMRVFYVYLRLFLLKGVLGLMISLLVMMPGGVDGMQRGAMMLAIELQLL
jgi:hypothetical protein